MGEEKTMRGYLYVPANRNAAVLAYVVEHATIALPAAQPAKAPRGTEGDPLRRLRATSVQKAADEAAAPGLYRAKLLLRPNAMLAADRFTVVRSVKAGSPLDEIRRLQAVARRRPDGKRPNPRALRDARRARAMCDALRRHVLPVYAIDVNAADVGVAL